VFIKGKVYKFFFVLYVMKKGVFLFVICIVFLNVVLVLGERVDEDIDLDGEVSFLDLVTVASKVGEVGCNAGNNGCPRRDVSGNGRVEFEDLVRVSGRLGYTYCVQNCGNRVCGVDPKCGESCGPDCESGFTCNAAGQCVEDVECVGHGQCNDGLFCTEDRCVDGVCFNELKDVDDGVSCTEDSCDEVGNQILHEVNDSFCDDSVACTLDSCDAVLDCQIDTSVCSCTVAGDCPDLDCNSKSCDAGECVYVGNDTLSCDDGDACSSGDSCSGGSCSGTAISCDDGKECTVDSCDSGSGCLNVPKVEGTACGDGSYFCDLNGDCVACLDVFDCADGDVCTDDICSGGVCSNPFNTVGCDDLIGCTAGDVCSLGDCNGVPNDGLCGDGESCVIGSGCVQTSCSGCEDCDNWFFDSCSYAECHAECQVGEVCYYRGVLPLLEDCVSLSYACSNLVSVCSDYSDEECAGDGCGLGCEFVGEGCVSVEVCGDGVCSGGEDCVSCEADCGGCGDCTDSDGGIDYFNNGTADNGTAFSDVCLDSENLTEYYCSSSAPDDYVSYWKFEGNADDESGVNNGSVVGDPVVSSCQVGSCYDFDADKIEASGSDLKISGDLTVSFWFNTAEGMGGNKGLVTHAAPGDSSGANVLYSIQTYDSDQLKYYHEYGGGANEVETAWDYVFGVDTWYHVSVVRDVVAKEIDVYVDGSLEQTIGYVNNADGGLSGGLDIANNPSGGNGPASWGFDGKIDEVMVFNRGLSSAEVSEVYCSQGGVGCGGVGSSGDVLSVGYECLDSCVGGECVCVNETGCTSVGDFCDGSDMPYSCSLGGDGCLDRVNGSACGVGFSCVGGSCVESCVDDGDCAGLTGSCGVGLCNTSMVAPYQCYVEFNSSVDVCRASVGECDVDDYCLGSGSVSCPVDLFNASRTSCSLGFCDGLGSCFECLDDGDCIIGEICEGDVCVAETDCSDGGDNDGDGESDYPADFGCINRLDSSEGEWSCFLGF